MKKSLLVLTFPLAVFYLLSYSTVNTRSEGQVVSVGRPVFARATAFAVSPQLRDIAPAPTSPNARKFEVHELNSKDSANNKPVVQHDSDGALAQFVTTPMPATTLSFPGLENLDNGLIYNLLILPADMNGDVGPGHYVQIVNSLMRVYDKTGRPMSPPLKISSLFETLGTVCSTRNDGLAIVLYDQLADRWLVSQTCTAFPPFRQMVAVSKTGDPLGQYYAYEFVMPNVKLNDFPKFGVWPDAYYMSTDEYLGADYVGAGAFAFDRTKLLVGDATAGYIYFNLQVPVGPRRKGLLPSDMDGLRPPAPGSPNLFASYTATEYGDAQDAIRLYDFHANFADPLNSTFTERPESPIAVATFDPTSPDGRADISQPPPGEKLDSQSDRLNYRLAYRNLGTHESLVVNQTVRTSIEPYRAGVRVYEFRKTGSAYVVAEQATLGGASSSRWIASAAQDHEGNLAVQYNFVSDDKKPSIFYTGKLAGDPAGVFRQEGVLIEGTGVQKAFGWRWGEYSGMTVDPVDDCTFWMTNAYYTLESEIFSDFGWLTRIGAFKFAECTPVSRAVLTGSVMSAANGAAIVGAVVNASSYSRATDGIGNYGQLAVLPGSYEVTASARGYLPQTFVITVADGQSVVRNFQLQPIPIIENTDSQLTSESCAINGAAEPGETVTLDIVLRNTGVQNAANLTARLLPTSGIENPGSAQVYGSLPPNGAAVSRPFTFTIASSAGCGDVVTLNLELRDGESQIGNIAIRLQTGVQRIAFQEKFDGITSPNLPVGWTTSSTPNHQLWRTSSERNQSAPNSLFSPDPHQMGLNEVRTPPFTVTSTEAEIRFRNWYELETTFLRNRLYDGSVMEIKLGDGEWQDILAAGGLFTSGGYDGVIDGCCQNPLAGRMGWSGRSGINQAPEFITTRAKLPASASGQTAELRWRIGTDIGAFREGQYIDDLVVTDGYVCECENTSKAVFDFDGDGKTDLSLYNLNSGSLPDFRILRSTTNAESSSFWGMAADIPANADIDGDGKTDLVVFRPSEGTWYILRSSDGGFSAVRFGIANDLPVPADYDGDGKADVAVFRSGVWYILRSSDGHAYGYAFGLEGDKPVNNDFDGDGKSDIAVFRPSNGTWYITRSSDAGFDITAFGLGSDVPISGDYDGDGLADRVVFRPSAGVWYLLRSSAGFSAAQFGLAGDLPLQADFDGDGRADIAVFRPSSKVWYHLRSSDGEFAGSLYGEGNQRPVPGIYVDR